MLTVANVIAVDKWEVVNGDAVEGIAVPRRIVVAALERNGALDEAVIIIEPAVLLEANFATYEANIIVVDQSGFNVRFVIFVIVDAERKLAVIDNGGAVWVGFVGGNFGAVNFAVQKNNFAIINEVAGNNVLIEVECDVAAGMGAFLKIC